jgi:hypothetical protein
MPITATAAARTDRQMANPDTQPERRPEQPEPPTPTAVERRLGVIQRWRERSAERRLARLLRPRERRALVQALRSTAKEATDRGACPHSSVLLRYRAAAVRTDLLEIAAILEHAHDPDPARIAALHDLLANGCDSPLYNPDIHPSELHATLHYIRSGL